MKTISVILFMVLFVLLFSGCANFENRLVCTVANDRAYVVSLYGPVGIGTQIAQKDSAIICK